MWYYVQDGQRVGPIAAEEVQPLIDNGTVQRTTQVWKAGMENWAQASTTELAALFVNQPPATTAPQPLPAVTQTASASGAVEQVPYEPGSFRTLWLWFAWLIGVGLPLCLLIIGLIPVIAGVVVGFVLLYRFWKVIQDGNPRTTAGKGLGFCFIPFFNLYWNYVANVGLAQDMNTYMNERNIDAPRINEGLTLAMYILWLCSLVPYIGILCGIANIVIMIIVYKQFSVASASIVEYKRNHAGTPGNNVATM